MHRPRIYKKRQPASHRLWRVEEFLQEYLYREKGQKKQCTLDDITTGGCSRRWYKTVLRLLNEGDLTEKGRDTTEDEDVIFEWDDTDEFAV